MTIKSIMTKIAENCDSHSQRVSSYSLTKISISENMQRHRMRPPCFVAAAVVG